jgi:transcriptional regulator with XRE-family HTH domain
MVADAAAEKADEAAVVAKALPRAARNLKISNRELAEILGYSESTISRMARGQSTPDPRDKQYELCALFLRVYRSLDAFAGGDPATAARWLRAPNIGLAGLTPDDHRRPRAELKDLGRVPIDAMKDIQGLIDVATYLDARRGQV